MAMQDIYSLSVRVFGRDKQTKTIFSLFFVPSAYINNYLLSQNQKP